MSGISFEAYNQRKVNRWALHRLVGKFQDANTPIGKQHVKDLKHTAITLYNSIIDALQKERIQLISFIQIVTDTSKHIEETTLAREKVGPLEKHYKDHLFSFYFEEGEDYQHTYRIPNKVDTFERFGKKTDRVKDIALTVVQEMYEQDHLYHKEIMEEVNKKNENTKENVCGGGLINDINEAFQAFSNGKITKEEYMNSIKRNALRKWCHPRMVGKHIN